jgi:hypothetical protein
MSSGNAHQSAWSDEHHNGAAIDWEDRIAAYDTMDAGAHLSQSDFDGGERITAERRERADREWLKRVMG